MTRPPTGGFFTCSERHVGTGEGGTDAPLDLHELCGRGAMALSAMQAGHGVQVTALRAGPVRGQTIIERHTLAGAERPHALQAMQGHGVRVGAPRAALWAAQAVRVWHAV